MTPCNKRRFLSIAENLTIVACYNFKMSKVIFSIRLSARSPKVFDNGRPSPVAVGTGRSKASAKHHIQTATVEDRNSSDPGGSSGVGLQPIDQGEQNTDNARGGGSVCHQGLVTLP